MGPLKIERPNSVCLVTAISFDYDRFSYSAEKDQ